MSLFASLAKASNLSDVKDRSRSRGNIGGQGSQRTGLVDDFLGQALSTALWSTAAGTDPQAVAPAITVAVGGVCRLTTGDAGTGVAADGSQLTSALQWQPDQGEITLEARIKLSAITNVIVNVGFTDTESLELPFEIGAADALTSNAADAACFVFDTGAATDNWFAAGVKGNTDAGPTNIGNAPVAGTYENFKLILTTAGHAHFYRNGVFITSLQNAVTPTVALTPIVIASADSTASRNIDLDYLYVTQALTRGNN